MFVAWQVSDLDGTMVGNGHEADAMTHNFKQYWEDNAALRNSVLVYNTGRSLGQFTSLYQEKAGALALPNVLITAVGTKVAPFCSPMHSSLLFAHSQLASSSAGHSVCTSAPAPVLQNALACTCLSLFYIPHDARQSVVVM